MAVMLRTIPNFDQLTIGQAEEILRTQVLPACVRKGVWLTRYGNTSFGEGTLKPHLQDNQTISFNIPRIQKAFSTISLLEANGEVKGFQALKSRMEALDGDISEGDLIVAVLVRGYIANFHHPLTMSCDITKGS